MALTCGFYNSLINTADRKYDASQISSIFDGVIVDGVFSTVGSAFRPTVTGTDLNVTVGTGKAWFNHTWTLLDTAMVLAFDAADPILYRIDAICLEVDTNTGVRNNSIKIIKGATFSAGNYTYPVMINDGSKFQYPLSYVTRRPASATILQTDIQYLVGNIPVPFVTGLVQQMNTDAITANWTAQFNTWFNTIKGQILTDLGTSLATRITALETLTAPWVALISGFTTNVNALLTRMTSVETRATNLEGNRFKVAQVFTAVTGITGADVTLVTAPAVLGDGVKRFKITASFEQVVSGAADVYNLNIRYNGAIIRDTVVFCNSTTAGNGSTLVVTHVPTAGSATYSFTAFRFSGVATGQVRGAANSPIEIIVEQISGQ